MDTISHIAPAARAPGLWDMDWFERLTGFRECGYENTRRQLEIDGRHLRSRVNGKTYGIGELELVSLDELRERVRSGGGLSGRTSVQIVVGDVRRLHAAREHAGALFQVASQFNLLEMVAPHVTPEDGVTRYEHDPTQGPACAIAAGAATIYRNYFVPIGDGAGQTRDRQLDGLAHVGEALSRAIHRPTADLWSMQNGYALCTRDGLDSIAAYIKALSKDDLAALRGKLRLGLHRDVEVTDADGPTRPIVSQCFCSALPVAYSRVPSNHWQAFATLILEAAYEATLLAAVAIAQHGGSNEVFLTRLGGGAFGNADAWIDSAMRRALQATADTALDVRIVSYGAPSRGLLELAASFR
jgi:hypothetical protein